MRGGVHFLFSSNKQGNKVNKMYFTNHLWVLKVGNRVCKVNFTPHHTWLLNCANQKTENNTFITYYCHCYHPLYGHEVMNHHSALLLLPIIQAFLSNAVQVLMVLPGSQLYKKKLTLYRW